MPKDYLALVSPYGYYTPFYIERKRGITGIIKFFRFKRKSPIVW